MPASKDARPPRRDMRRCTAPAAALRGSALRALHLRVTDQGLYSPKSLTRYSAATCAWVCTLMLTSWSGDSVSSSMPQLFTQS